MHLTRTSCVLGAALLILLPFALGSPAEYLVKVIAVLSAEEFAFKGPRYAWADDRHHEVYVADRDAGLVWIFDGGGNPLGSMEAKRVLAGCMSEDELLVLDQDGERLARYNARGDRVGLVTITDLPWSRASGAQAPRFNQVAQDRRRRLYLSDSVNKVVVVTTDAGRYLRHFGRAPGETEGLAFQAVSSFCLWGDRRICILDGGRARVVVFAVDGEYLFEFGKQGGHPGELAMPVGVAVDAQDRILVLDKTRHAVSVYDRRGEYQFEFGGLGKRPGWFYFPDSITVDAQGRVLVAEASHKRVQILELVKRPTALAAYERIVGGERGGAELKRPSAFVYDQERSAFLVADSGNARVSAFHRDGRHLWSIDQEVIEPAGVCWSPSGQVYVAEMGADVIKVFDPRGRLDRTISLAEHARGRPVRPGHMVLGAGGILYVVDRANAQIIVLNSEGKALGAIGRRGQGEGRLLAPQDLAVDAQRRVWVVDAQADLPVQCFHLDGRFLSGFGRHGDAREALASPSGIALDAQGRVWITDAFRHAVQVYDASGAMLFRWGEAGTEPGQLQGPAGIQLTADGYAMVLEKPNARISIFKLNAETSR